MNISSKITRRRFISIMAGACAAGALPALAASGTPLQRWRGYVLGAEGEISFVHPDPKKLVRLCLDEILRLEQIFSLYEPKSALSRLNRDGRLTAPPPELVALLRTAKSYYELTGGAFDVTIQPLWEAYAAAKGRPAAAEIKAALARTGMDHLRIAPDELAFARPGMAVTLNGIAQGYITDRVTVLLEKQGLRHVLAALGETRALGRHPAGRPWQVGLQGSQGLFDRVALYNEAVATSGGYGTPMGAGAHHILDPRTGKSAGRYDSLSVRAPKATAADALSTGLSLLSPAEIKQVMAQTPGCEAIICMQDGTVHKFPH